MESIEFLEGIIKKYNLKKKWRYYEYIYNRYAFFHFCRKVGLSFETIGKMVDKNHSTVMHGCRKHKEFTEMNDSIYMKATLDIEKDLLNCPPIKKEKVEDVVKKKEDPIVVLINMIFETQGNEHIKAYINENINPKKI